MVKARKAIESLYDGRCTITENRKVKNEDFSTSFEEVVVLENQPCRLSFQNVSSATPTDSGAFTIAQSISVFLAPEIVVKEGSKLTISQNGITTDYRYGGKSAHYSTHQIIKLEIFESWA